MDNSIYEWSYNYDLSLFYWSFLLRIAVSLATPFNLKGSGTRDKSSAAMMAHPGFIAVVAIAQLSKDNAAVTSPFHHAQPFVLCVGFVHVCSACSNTRARGTVCDYGGPILAETDGSGVTYNL